ncbi:actin-5-like [Discoglossus pictus]
MFDSNILEIPSVIFDNGSGLCKAGLSGHKAPMSVITTIVGRSKLKSSMLGAGQRDYYIGEEAQSRRGILVLSYPIEHGIVTSWDDMERIWRYMYRYELRMKASKRPVLLTEAPFNPLQNREKMTEIMFENFKVPAMYVAVQANLALYAAGRTSGMVLDSGDGVTHTVPIHNGYCLQHPGSRLDLAGRDITECLMKLLFESGHLFVSTAEREIVRDMKEKLCYVALDPESEMKKQKEDLQKKYTLPDGISIHVGSQLFRAPEILFEPLSMGINLPGVHKMMLNSIMTCNKHVQKNLYSNILLSGGSTLFPGIEERILKELKHQVSRDIPVRIIAAPDRKYCVWIGASILSSLPDFRNMLVTIIDYNEFGPGVTHRKCI